MTKNQVKLGQVKGIPAVIFSATFGKHMEYGDQKGTSHSGLHIIEQFKKSSNSQKLAAGDIQTDREYQGTLNERATTVEITAVDLRAKTFIASVNIYSSAKVSTFFPVGTTLEKAKEYIREAWKDHCTYGSSQYGGGDVDIYKQMRDSFALKWVGMATIESQQIWVGSGFVGPNVDTAFPAVNNKFK
jgi:hypothetical protein